jgi:hypothetical protein
MRGAARSAAQLARPRGDDGAAEKPSKSKLVIASIALPLRITL